MHDCSGSRGWGVVRVINPDGSIAQEVPFSNLITTKGDEAHAKLIAGVSVTAATGMKLGTGTTAPAKSSTGAALVTYVSGSNALLDSGYPTAAAYTGTDTGWVVTYQCTWAAGTATATGLGEVVLVNDAATDATSDSTATYARALISPTVDKGAGQALTVIWNQKHLGA